MVLLPAETVMDWTLQFQQIHLFSCFLQDLGDEIDCDVPTCGEWLRNFYGSFSSPNYPDFYPPGSNCTWLIDTGDHRKVTSDLSPTPHLVENPHQFLPESCRLLPRRSSSGSQTLNWTGPDMATT